MNYFQRGESKLSDVSIIKVHNDDVLRAVKKAITITQGFDSIQWENATVLIKPNTVNPSESGSGKVTDARVVDAVVQTVKEKDPHRIVIGEGSSVGYDFPGREDSIHCMKVAGILDVAKKHDVEVVDLNRDEQVEVELREAFVMDSFKIAKTAQDADVMISLPVIKTHIRTGITCGLKNMKGVLPGDEKKRTHLCGLDRGIVDLNRAVKPHYTVVDAIVGMQGTNSEEADKVPMDLIVAGDDVVAVDSVCAALAGFHAEDLLHIQLAAEAGLGIADLNRIDIFGEKLEAVRQPFIPFLEASKDLFGGATILEQSTCTGCMGELVSLFIYLKEAGFQDRLADLTLIAGTLEDVKGMDATPLIIGRCAKAHRKRGIFVPGCPPHGKKITEAACEALGIDKAEVRRTVDALHDA